MIFFGKKKTPRLPDLSWIGTDMHSHLVPGIDDGVPDLDAALHLIKGFAALGYRKLITTPHVLWDLYPNSPQTILPGLEAVQQAARAEGMDIELQGAAEYFMDEHFQQLVQEKTPLLTLRDQLVLVEFSMLTAPLDLQDMLFQLQIQGYQPVIAHPERYAYLQRRRDFFDELKTSGCLFQLNILSVTGHYGAVVQELADYLLRKGYYDYAGTDMHHARHLESLQRLTPSQVQKIRDSGSIKNHLL